MGKILLKTEVTNIDAQRKYEIEIVECVSKKLKLLIGNKFPTKNWKWKVLVLKISNKNRM